MNFAVPMESKNCPRIAIAPDSFKGTLTACQATTALAQGLRQSLPQATLLEYPLADGGEGTLDVIQSVVEGQQIGVTVKNAVGHSQVVPFYQCEIEGHAAAVVEVAQVVGITDLSALSHPVEQRTTLGLGELMGQILAQDIRHIYVGLGGSSTNDGGVGLLAGLGARLLDAQGQILSPTPEGLAQLAQVDLSELDPQLQSAHIVLLSDVNSPLCGPQGATHTFGPQKGLTDTEERDRLDRHLFHFATLVEQTMARLQPHRADILGMHTLPGSGAAGGLGFAFQLLGGIHTSGAQWIAECLGLPQALANADWLITGEGKSDRQTLQGKAPWVVAQMAHRQGIPVTLLSGAIALEDQSILEAAFQYLCFSLAAGPTCCFPPASAPTSLEDCCTHAFEWMVKAGVQLGHQWLIQVSHQSKLQTI